MILDKICSPQAMAFYLSRNTNLFRELDANVYPLYAELDSQKIPLETARAELFLLKTSAIIQAIRQSNKSEKKKSLVEQEYRKVMGKMFVRFFGDEVSNFDSLQDVCLECFSNPADKAVGASDENLAASSFLQRTGLGESQNARQFAAALFKLKHDYNFRYLNKKWLK